MALIVADVRRLLAVGFHACIKWRIHDDTMRAPKGNCPCTVFASGAPRKSTG